MDGYKTLLLFFFFFFVALINNFNIHFSRESNYDDIENYRPTAVYSNSNNIEEIYDDVTSLKATNKNLNGTKRRIGALIDSFNNQGPPKGMQQMYEPVEINGSGNS